MTLLRYADMSCECPNCGLKPSFDFPTCWVHIRWGNQFGGSFTVFCEHCRKSTIMTNVSGNITMSESKAINNQIVHWHTGDWKVKRLEYLEGIKEKFKISYRGMPEVYEKFDEEMAYLEYHIRG